MYIVFEWITGAGKSTQISRLKDFFAKKFPEKEVVFVREPWSTPIAQDIRILAQEKFWDNDYMHPLTNAYLYAAARAQLLHTVVIPALDAGKIVISDRCFLSSLAYQWEAQKLWFDKVMSINSEAVTGVIPDIVLYMDVDIDIAMRRVFDSKWDKWETMWRQFFMDTAIWYEKCSNLDIVKDKFYKINSNVHIDDVTHQIEKIIISKIN